MGLTATRLGITEQVEEYDAALLFLRQRILGNAALASLIGQRIYEGAAPLGTADLAGFDPFMIVASIRDYPVSTRNARRRIKAAFDFKAVFIVPVDEESDLHAPLVALNGALHRTRGDVTWNDDSGNTYAGRVLGCDNRRTFRQVEQVNGRLLVQRGHVYHLEIQSRGVTPASESAGTP